MIVSTIIHALKKLYVRYRNGINRSDPPHRELRPDIINRRAFILRAAGFLITLFLSPFAVRAANKSSSVPLKDPWHTLAVVQEHLFPSETDSPGAKEINAIEYLRNVVDDPTIDSDEKEFILNGVKWLNDLALEKHKAVFTDLSQIQRANMLQQITKTTAGRNWISKLLSYIFEALLSDPVYGGNPNGIGWKWLEHYPGFPRPPMNKRYLDLMKI